MTSTVSNNPVTFRAIIPKKLNINGMFAPIRDACIKDAKAMGKDLEKITQTWKGDKPKIQTEVKLAKPDFHGSFTVSAWPRADNSQGYWKYVWLDKGTKVRYAHMTKGFIPKTRYHQLNSWGGKGGMAFVNSKNPKLKRPGIKARQFTATLRKRWDSPFTEHIKTAVKEAAKASGHSLR